MLYGWKWRFIGFAVLVLLCSGGSAWSQADDAGQILFVGVNHRLLSVNADGSVSEEIAFFPAFGYGDMYPSPDGTRIAVEMSSNLETRIDVMNLDGSERFQLTDSGNYPVWSPDGTRIAFASGTDGEVYVSSVDEPPAIQLTNYAYRAERIVWSPDGTHIAFTNFIQFVDDPNQSMNMAHQSDIYVIDANGTDQTRLSETDHFSSVTAWSPDGTRLVFNESRQSDWDSDPEIFVIDADGANRVQLTENTDSDNAIGWLSNEDVLLRTYRNGTSELYRLNLNTMVEFPIGASATQEVMLSPDATRIVFRSSDDGSFDVINVDGSGQIQLTTTDRALYLLGWTPDGQSILVDKIEREFAIFNLVDQQIEFTTELPSSIEFNPSEFDIAPDGERLVFRQSGGIFVMSLSEMLPHRLAFDGYNPLWSPDGLQIMFTNLNMARRKGEIYVMNADGSGQRYMMDGFSPTWSPDGQQITYYAMDGDDSDIFVGNIDGTGRARLTPESAIGNELYPAWHPSGDRIAYLSAGDGAIDIYTIRPDGMDETRLTDTGDIDASSLAWSPDGSQLLFYRRGDLWMMNADGTNQALLRENMYSLKAVWMPTQ